MERSEPELVPEWLRNTGTISGSGNAAHQSASSSSLSGVLVISRHAYSSFSRSHRDKDREWHKERLNFGVRWDRDSSDPLESILASSVEKLGGIPTSRVEIDTFRQSHSMVSRKQADPLAQRTAVDSRDRSISNNDNDKGLVSGGAIGSSIQKDAFRKDFPSLGIEERQSVPEIASYISWFELSFSVFILSVVPSATSALNMAVALAQAHSRVRTASQLSVNTQRREELAIKQSRQLIPETPSMPKGSIDVEYANGIKFSLSAEFLRGYSPAADGKIDQSAVKRFAFSGYIRMAPCRDNVCRTCRKLWGKDGFPTGIYSWDCFYNLGSNEFTLIRNYMRSLKKHGLSRDPSKRKSLNDPELKPIIQLKNFIVNDPNGCIPISAVSNRGLEFDISIRVARFLRQYPSVRGEHNLPWFRLTPEAAEIDREEKRLLKEWHGIWGCLTVFWRIQNGILMKLLGIECPLFPSKVLRLRRKIESWLNEFQNLPYVSPYEDFSHLDPDSNFAEKRVVGILHELLSLFVEHSAERKKLLCLKKYFGLPQKVHKSFERHPHMFYLSFKNRTCAAILKETYCGNSSIKRHPLLVVRKKYIQLLKVAGDRPAFEQSFHCGGTFRNL
ncbi:pumilio-like protein 4-like [Hibiscus syriacus]|uniref:Pumilio-like protein 4-like n=1 Tax=Hibiscus syriacus TaxID=106335 RepID=A0A6A3BTV9_HIBSY|nr:pumilio-like protein 4-like [Hibiscus syriacus]